jgi:hypothetical protein
MAADRRDKSNATDLGQMQIVRFEDGSALLGDDDAGCFNRLSCQDDLLAFTDGERVLLADTQGQVIFSGVGAPLTAAMRFFKLAAWIGTAVLALMALWVVVRLLRHAASRQHSRIFRAAALAGSAICSHGVVSVIILCQMTTRIDNQALSNLRQTAQTLSQSSGQTFGDAVEKINTLGDYGSEPYRLARSYLDISCAAAYEKGGNQYYIVFKRKGDLLYGVMDYENTIGTIYP